MNARTHTLDGTCTRRGRRLCGTKPFVVLLGVLVWSSFGDALAATRKAADKDITSAIESEFWGDDAVNANAVDVKTQEGVVTLTGSVENILVKERAEKIAESIVGVRAIVNRVQVKPALSHSDAEIQNAVKDALLRDPATDSYEVATAVSGGTVTLTGSVDSWEEKQLCATVAKGVKGVRDVRNDIEVNYKASRSDNEIEQEVKARLENDVLVDDYLISVSVKDEKVSLSGTVGSLAEKNRALRDAWVGGVNAVDGSGLEIEWWARDKMRRNSSGSRTDEEIKKAVKDAFLYDPRVLSFNPTVDVQYGTVTLTGVVDNLRAKKAAEEDARNVIGVWRVKNHLKVRPTTVPTNDDLEKRVSKALREDPFVERWDVGVEAHSGFVYLSGDVNTSFEKHQAERVTEGVKGVVSVVNTIEYDYAWSWKRDQEIREDVKDQLFWSPFVDENEVSVTVDNGVVTLTGEVDTWSERDAAEQNAFEGGAKDVRNNLTVRYRYYGPFYPYYGHYVAGVTEIGNTRIGPPLARTG